MFYLIKPDTTVLWNDLPESVIDQLAKDNPDTTIDLRRLTWHPSERWFDAGLLNTALRYGIAVADGLVVGGQALVPLDYFRSMEAILNKEIERDSTNVPHADLMEAVMPGWKQNTRDLDARVLESQRRTVERAQREMLKAFEKPIDTALAEHWQKLGGSLPPQPPG
ncbi:hypothetical protein [Mycobacterium sp. MMS18-G62]